MMHPDVNAAAGVNARGKLKQRRSRKACQHCHTRKIRCNVLENGTPCANCVDAGTTCIIRRRKNQRRESTPPDQRQAVLDRTHSFPVWSNGNAHQRQHHQQQQQHHHQQQPQQQQEGQQPQPQVQHSQRSLAPNGISSENNGFANGVESQSQSSTPPLSADGCNLWPDLGNELNAWEQNSVVDASSASCDFSHLTDLDDIFTFTGNTFPTTLPHFQSDFGWNPTYAQQNHLSPPPVLPGPGINENGNLPLRPPSSLTTSVHIPGLNPRDHEYLRGEGCFDLPPAQVLKQMMRMYFRMNHPNLPVIAEDQFWALWNGDEFRVDEFSFLLLRAMIFAATCYTELETLLSIGFVSKREARNTYYRHAKLLFDFSIERDAVCSAQACLLLSYNSPKYNILRLNTYWVTNAMRFARIARANSYHRARDPVKSKLLKRLWWGVIFRDRILSLGLRRSVQFELDPSWAEGEKHTLTAEDFQSELGNSQVHDPETQLRIFEVIAATCRLMRCISHANRIMYTHEHLDDRLEAVSKSVPGTIADIKRCLESLRQWHDQSIRLFPFPISLDDAHETICVYANLMFSYHVSAVFGLNTYLILLREVFPSARSLFSLEESKEALEAANNDVSRRTQELVQVRLVKFLPISASAILALPLVLQAINVAAARGSGMEAVEIRRLDVFTRTLKSQQQSFDGSDFCSDVLANIVAYAQDDTKLVSSMTSWRDGTGKDVNSNAVNGGNLQASAQGGQNKIKLDWGNLVYKRPRLFLRLVLYLDQAFSRGGPPQDEDFPPELQRASV